MALNIDCQVTDEAICGLKRQNEDLRFRLGQEIDAGHKLDRDFSTLKADLMHVEREEESMKWRLNDSAAVGHANQDLHAVLADLRAKNDLVLEQNRKLQADLET